MSFPVHVFGVSQQLVLWWELLLLQGVLMQRRVHFCRLWCILSTLLWHPSWVAAAAEFGHERGWDATAETGAALTHPRHAHVSIIGGIVCDT